MKAGIVGLGYRMEYLAGLFTDLVPGFRIVGYVDPSPAGLPGLRQRAITTGPAYESIEALTKAEAPDLLMIGSPNHMHLEHLTISLGLGLRVFCEKPVVVSEEETLA